VYLSAGLAGPFGCPWFFTPACLERNPFRKLSWFQPTAHSNIHHVPCRLYRDRTSGLRPFAIHLQLTYFPSGMPVTVAPATHLDPPPAPPSQPRPTRQTTVSPLSWLGAGVPLSASLTRLSATLPSRHLPATRAFATIYFRARERGSRSFDNRFAMHDHRLTYLHDNRLTCALPRLPARLAQGRRFVEVPRRLLLRRWRHR